jgi:multiple sugar transport system permease protein
MISTKVSTKKVANFLLLLARYALALLIAFIMALPFAWMLGTSFKPIDETVRFPPTFLPERAVGFANYQEVMTRAPFFLFFANSTVVAVAVTTGALLTSALAGYIFAKFTFWGRDTLFFMIVSTMMVPFHVVLIPIFLMTRALGLYNTLWALIVPGLVTAWGIFLMRQYMKSMPSELLDAARIDGASEMGIFARIVLPLSRPGLAALGIFIFMANWNSFLWPVIVIADAPKRTLPLGLAIFSQGFGITRWNLVMAATVLTCLPILIVFAIAQRSFIEGITLGGLKG